MDKKTQMEQEQLEELARRLAAAAISIYMGISLSHCYNLYAKDGKPGLYWIDLARKIQSDHIDVDSISIN